MRILITGSSGQIGTNLALYLLEQGHSVFGIDIRTNTWTDAFPTLLQDLGRPYRHFEKGIGHVDYLDDLDLVVHFAAHAKVHELVEQPDRALNNITMTFNVLEFCRHNTLPLIFSSTREVYGDIHHYITEESHADFAFTESPYSASKIAGEALVYSYARCYDLKFLVFRFSNVYGRYDSDLERMERVIPLFIKQIGDKQPITIYGEDKQLDFTYVDDCVSGVVSGIELLLEGEDVNHTINLAYGQGNSLVTMAQYIGETLGVSPEIIIKPTRKGEVTRYIANIGKARAILGYQPETPLKEGIEKAVAWNLDWQSTH
ncbi:nucleoside-diphosphate sugar epimerase [candidate division KSB3 bacterium]|uniref:Nucleoside-diphosphate sugar epimerase n=1 Tax=candidate division KSB3 bacterium TaxID=2044937 RepID=A0A2G6KKS0_9BACT|nr:MAG: nucleoside-diphosphate sugar epimerase [candidate division KSB3 bacterium]